MSTYTHMTCTYTLHTHSHKQVKNKQGQHKSGINVRRRIKLKMMKENRQTNKEKYKATIKCDRQKTRKPVLKFNFFKVGKIKKA